MARRRRRVFILGGGAALGAHHVGALKYLESEGIKPDAIIASSIGVINACAYVSGGVPLLERAWRELRSLPLIFSPSLRDNPLFGRSLFSADRLTRALESYMDFPKVLESQIPIHVILLNVSRGRGELYSQRDCGSWRDLRTLVRAGYALPLLLPPVRFKGDWFVDGGFAWNVPLEHALTLQPSEIFVLAPIASALPYRSAFTSFYDYSRRLADVLWRTIGNMGYLYAPIEGGRLGDVPITVIEPGEEWSGFGPLAVFQAHPRKSAALMAAGQRDAKRALAERRRLEERERATAGAARETLGEARGVGTGAAEAARAVIQSSKVIVLGRSSR